MWPSPLLADFDFTGRPLLFSRELPSTAFPAVCGWRLRTRLRPSPPPRPPADEKSKVTCLQLDLGTRLRRVHSSSLLGPSQRHKASSCSRPGRLACTPSAQLGTSDRRGACNVSSLAVVEHMMYNAHMSWCSKRRGPRRNRSPSMRCKQRTRRPHLPNVQRLSGVVRYSLRNMLPLPLPHSRPPDTGDDHGAVARLDLWGNGCSRSLDLSEPANSLAQPWQKTISSPSRVLICKAAACASHSETLRAFLPAVLPRFSAPRISARLSHEHHLG